MGAQKTFFLDRGLGGKILVGRLRAAGWICETMNERYGQEVGETLDDTQWIADATAAGDVLLCKDRQIAWNALEAQMVYMHNARVFVIATQSVTAPEMADWYLNQEAGIMRWAGKQGPFVCGVYRDKLARLKLNYPSS